jgi:hypothetical protein
MKRLLHLLVLLTAVGCTPVAYTRPGATSTQAEVDERECRSLAAMETAPLSVYRYHSYRRNRLHPADAFMDRMLSESGLSDFCMRSRGYSLQPVPSPS